MRAETQRPAMLPVNNTTESVHIRVHGVDGSIRTFSQHNAALITQTLDCFQPALIFKQQRIEIPGDHSLTTFIAAQVARIDIVTEPLASWSPHSEAVEAVELTEAAFRALAKSPHPAETQQPSPPLENATLVIIDIALTGGHRVFLAQETTLPQPSQNIDDLGAILPATSLAFLMRTGGIGVLNVANLVSLTVYPDPAQLSAGVWTCRQRKAPELGAPQPHPEFPGFGEQEAA